MFRCTVRAMCGAHRTGAPILTCGTRRVMDMDLARGFFNRPHECGRVSGFGGRYAWARNPEHRMEVPYPNRGVASRFGSNRYNGGRGNVGQSGGSGAWQRLGEGNRSARSGPSRMRGFAGSGDRMGRGGNGGSRDYRSQASPGFSAPAA